MGMLRSALEELRSDDPASRTHDELRSDVAEISATIAILTHQLAVRVHQVAQRATFGTEGFLNVTSWLAATADIDHSTARRLVTLGKTLAAHPETARRFGDGALSQSRVRILARAAAKHPNQYRHDEEMLLGFAHDLALRDLDKAVEYWSNCADDDAAEKSAQDQRDSAYLHVSQTLAGMVRLDGLFDKEAGDEILTALDAAMTPRARGEANSDDPAPAPRRRAQALGHICRQHLNHHPGTLGGHRPHVSVIIDLPTLNGHTGRRCELGHVGTITPETARRILCDAEVSWAIVNGDSVPLAMGRSARTATPSQLRALAIRDGGCVTPGCQRPPAWCDAHHKTPWSQHGPTNLDNLELRCRPHHTQIHQQHHSIRRQ